MTGNEFSAMWDAARDEKVVASSLHNAQICCCDHARSNHANRECDVAWCGCALFTLKGTADPEGDLDVGGEGPNLNQTMKDLIETPVELSRCSPRGLGEIDGNSTADRAREKLKAMEPEATTVIESQDDLRQLLQQVDDDWPRVLHKRPSSETQNNPLTEEAANVETIEAAECVLKAARLEALNLGSAENSKVGVQDVIDTLNSRLDIYKGLASSNPTRTSPPFRETLIETLSRHQNLGPAQSSPEKMFWELVALHPEKKIARIKAVSDHTGLNLKMAKKVMDAMNDQIPYVDTSNLTFSALAQTRADIEDLKRERKGLEANLAKALKKASTHLTEVVSLKESIRTEQDVQDELISKMRVLFQFLRDDVPEDSVAYKMAEALEMFLDQI